MWPSEKHTNLHLLDQLNTFLAPRQVRDKETVKQCFAQIEANFEGKQTGAPLPR
jgi:hypothetical protein